MGVCGDGVVGLLFLLLVLLGWRGLLVLAGLVFAVVVVFLVGFGIDGFWFSVWVGLLYFVVLCFGS